MMVEWPAAAAAVHWESLVSRPGLKVRQRRAVVVAVRIVIEIVIATIVWEKEVGSLRVVVGWEQSSTRAWRS